MGKYKHFIMGLLEQIMIPAHWMSADEVYDRLNDMKTISEKKYVQLPTKQSLAQQMCRFFTHRIKVKKESAKNLYCLMITEDDHFATIQHIQERHGIDPEIYPEDWAAINQRVALSEWMTFLMSIDKEDEEEFELW